MMTFQPSLPQSFWGGPRPNPHRHSTSRCGSISGFAQPDKLVLPVNSAILVFGAILSVLMDQFQVASLGLEEVIYTISSIHDIHYIHYIYTIDICRYYTYCIYYISIYTYIYCMYCICGLRYRHYRSTINHPHTAGGGKEPIHDHNTTTTPTPKGGEPYTTTPMGGGGDQPTLHHISSNYCASLTYMYICKL